MKASLNRPGSRDVKFYCLILNQGKWEQSNNLAGPREGHSAIETENGILLIGGAFRGSKYDTTEMVKYTGKSELTELTLKDDFRYI